MPSDTTWSLDGGYFDWGRPGGKDFSLHEIIVLGPYPSDRFFVRIVEDLKPVSIILVVDDGFSRADIGRVRQVIEDAREGTRVRVLYAHARGQVHAKAYFLTWAKPGGKWRRQTLFWGSANASFNGFERNAETFTFLELRRQDDRAQVEIREYFEQFREPPPGGAQPHAVEQQDVEIGLGTWLQLPEFELASVPDRAFDAWVRAGRICHKYEPDATFGRFTIQLKQGIPITGVETAFKDGGFRANAGSKVVRRAYLPSLTHTEKATKRRWRSNFFLETIYGHWTSEECFDDAQRGRLVDRFQHSKAAGRKADLMLLKKNGNEQAGVWIEEFLVELQQLTRRLKVEPRVKAEDYLRLKSGKLDEAHYRSLAKKQIGRDRGKAKHRSFAERYKTGYAFVRVPGMGGEFSDFVESLADSIAAAMTAKDNPTNRLASRIKAELEAEGLAQSRWSDGKRLYELITATVGKKEIERWKAWGPCVRMFHDGDLLDRG